MQVLAVAGKGGAGKTTMTALLMRWLHDNRSKSILAVDADPAANLGDMLGVAPRESVGAIREELRSPTGMPAGMSKQQFLEYRVHAGLLETPDFDLIAMGRPEGPGCYCYANNLLREIMDTIGRNYAFVVIDNEAGMEHVSRRTTRDIDHLFIVSVPTVPGVRTAGKIGRLADDLAVGVRYKHLVMNRVTGDLPVEVEAAVAREGLGGFFSIPEDEALYSMDRTGEPIWASAPETRAYAALAKVLQGIVAGDAG
jgi:CO dehydrogenase maturation factor